MHKPFNIVFMGTPDFAVPGLRALHESRHAVSLVVTQPDRPKGRGRKIHPPPVKTAALDLGYDVLQPHAMGDPEFVDRLKTIGPDYLVVIAYGKILPRSLIGLPRVGAVNIHASLLPKYRGPAPIQRAVINGEKETGVTAMLMDAKLDTGDILLAEKTQIEPDDTSGTLHDRLARMGAALLLTALDQYGSGEIRPIPQDHSLATYAPMIEKNDGHIDWSLPAAAIECKIRGMDPWPGAFVFLDDNRLKIFKARTLPGELSPSSGAPLSSAPWPGTVLQGFPDELRVAAGIGALSILELQGASGKRLKIHDFLRGFPIPPGTVFR
ncbi:methionyl-tRNA formyltransferase [Desulfococcus sp.]|uniref:methionyl-tRNA formyltransferase n=1 Tax=Desulfococcus sp. TaxID=2025834 RepID=UPI003593CA5F